MKFQSTLPVRGATSDIMQVEPVIQISIHAPREGSDIYGDITPVRWDISIHAPREGSDEFDGYEYTTLGDFNPRSP